MAAEIVSLQAPAGAPDQTGLDHTTDPLVANEVSSQRLGNFPEEVYDLSAESHLMRFIKVLLGDAGVGDLRKRLSLARMQGSLASTHFLDLDRFYGALFDVRRSADERLPFNPYVDNATGAEWRDAHGRDASYRSRIIQFARALGYGPTPTGMELVAEALLSVDCDVFESYIQADASFQTYAELEATYPTYSAMNGQVYSELEGYGLASLSGNERRIFYVRPKRAITLEEAYNLTRAIARLKPVDARFVILPEGSAVHTPVSVRGALADSTGWEITQRISAPSTTSPYLVVSSTPVEQPRPPFSNYEGEAWTYNGDIAGVLAYTEEVAGGPAVTLPTERVYFGDVYVDYDATEAILPRQYAQTGRLVSDGILLVNPYVGSRPAVSEPIVSSAGQVVGWTGNKQRGNLGPLYADRVPIQSLIDALGGIPAPANPSERFWTTPPRPQADTTREVLEVRLSTARPVNYFSIEVAHFPQTVTVEGYDAAMGTWTALYTYSVRDSLPTVASVQVDQVQTHPMHRGAGHWLRLSGRLDPTLSSRFRVVLERAPGTPPLTPLTLGVAYGQTSQNPVPYPLGLRGLDLGYRITSRRDVPQPEVDGSVGTTTDALGGLVKFFVEDFDAALALTSDPDAWRSEPQPVNYAVVNYHLDVRDGDGEPQVIDRLYVEPTHVGVHATLYYTNEQQVRGFKNAPLPPGSVVNEATEVFDGLNCATGAVTINAPTIGWDFSDDWWAGMDLTLTANPPIVIFDTGEIYVEILAGSIRMWSPYGWGFDLNFPGHTIVAGTRIQIAFEREGSSAHMQAQVQFPNGFTSGGNGAGPWSGAAPLRRADVTIDGAFILHSMIAKNAPVFAYDFTGSDFEVWSYVDGSDTFVLTPQESTQARLRYHPNFGFVGDTPIEPEYDQMTWIPIPRDYVLHKGFLKMPPTQARFLKIEMTNLTAEHQEMFLPMTKRVRLFPQAVVGVSLPRQTGAPESSLDPGVQIVQQVNRHAALDAGESATASNTEALYAIDPNAAQRLRDADWTYAFGPWHQGIAAPRFTQIQRHAYETVEVLQTSKTAFFAGFHYIAPYRLDFEADDDTAVYEEHFSDEVHLAALAQWTLDPGSITADVGDAAQESITMFSRHNVVGVEFATEQSAPVQVMPDDDFKDSALAQYDWTDDTRWHRYGDAQLVYSALDNSVLTLRHVVAPPMTIDASPGPVRLEVEPTFDYRPHTAADEAAAAATVGGIESPAITLPTPASGRLWAAVRFTALTDLTSPLILQVVAESNGVILAEREVTALRGQTIEMEVPYDMGTFYQPPPETTRYPFRSIVDVPVQDPGIDPPLTPLPPVTPTVVTDDTVIRVRLIQQGKSDDQWRLDTLSLFDEGISWEWSNDGGSDWINGSAVRNKPTGRVTFANPGNQLRWRVRSNRPGATVTAIKIRPIYIGLLNARGMDAPLRGPNMSVYDHDVPIAEDPMFSGRDKPLPRWWYTAGRRYPILAVDPFSPSP